MDGTPSYVELVRICLEMARDVKNLSNHPDFHPRRSRNSSASSALTAADLHAPPFETITNR